MPKHQGDAGALDAGGTDDGTPGRRRRRGSSSPGSPSVEGLKGGAALDTLAQLDQNEGRESESLKILKKRARAKYFGCALATALADLRSPLEKSYRSTIYCAGCISQDGGVLTSTYCGQRWCSVCGRIRTGRALRAYEPIIHSWNEPYLVTLTIPNCPGEELRATLDSMLAKFTSCKRAIIRTHHLPFVAVRKLECTINRERKDYHPHFHVLVDGKEQAELLKALWLRRWKGAAVEAAQDVKPCDKQSTKELFKYFTKLVTRTTKGGKRVSAGVVDVEPLDVLFRAMRGRRVWQSVGFSLPKEVEESIEGEKLEVTGSVAFKRKEDRVLWEWRHEFGDWIDRETGECLSEYEPGERFRAFVEGIGAESLHVELVDDG